METLVSDLLVGPIGGIFGLVRLVFLLQAFVGPRSNDFPGDIINHHIVSC